MNLTSSQSQPSVSNLQHVLSMWMARPSRLRFGTQVSLVVALSIKLEALVGTSGWVPSSCLHPSCSTIVPFAHHLILFFLQLAKNVIVLSHLRTPGLLTLHSLIDWS